MRMGEGKGDRLSAAAFLPARLRVTPLEVHCSSLRRLLQMFLFFLSVFLSRGGRSGKSREEFSLAPPQPKQGRQTSPPARSLLGTPARNVAPRTGGRPPAVPLPPGTPRAGAAPAKTKTPPRGVLLPFL
uniref:Uncharacterized protein n=1 Tax=Myotis myotis TaxID=51298 RepID=A0A7J7RCJ7_MYOMY|nr:hypothetical protein mMyoMyo1_010841 [Myotis myotis]